MQSQPRCRLAVPPAGRKAALQTPPVVGYAYAASGPPGADSLQTAMAGDVPPNTYPAQLAGQDMVYYAPYTALYGAAFK